MVTKPTAAPSFPLPQGVTQADTTYRHAPASYSQKRWVEWQKKNRTVEPQELTLYYTERFGWVIATLHISNSRNRANPARTYGVDLKGNLVRVGAGPHVKQTVRLRLYEDRLSDLQPYIDLYYKGMEEAGSCRDRISTRRAQGTLRRSSYYNGF
jgi:hypothetical protein